MSVSNTGKKYQLDLLAAIEEQCGARRAIEFKKLLGVNQWFQDDVQDDFLKAFNVPSFIGFHTAVIIGTRSDNIDFEIGLPFDITKPEYQSDLNDLRQIIEDKLSQEGLDKEQYKIRSWEGPILGYR